MKHMHSVHLHKLQVDQSSNVSLLFDRCHIQQAHVLRCDHVFQLNVRFVMFNIRNNQQRVAHREY